MADQRQTLRPNALIANPPSGYSAGWAITGGDGTVPGVLSDNTDASYIQASSTSEKGVSFHMADFAMPVGGLIRQVRFRVRHTNYGVDGDLDVTQHYPGGRSIQTSAPAPNTDFGETQGFWYSALSGSPFLDSDLDNLYIVLDNKGGSTTYDARVSEFYIDVDYNEPPTGTITAPSGTVNDSTPTAQWTYSDPEGDAQTHFQVVVETGDHTADASPNLSTNEYNSGEVASSGTSHQLPALDEGTYTVWVRVRQADVSGQESRSLWNSELFTVDVLPPAVPTLTATADNTNKRVELTVDSNSPLGQEAEEYEVQYSDDGGTTWVYARGGNPITVDPVDSAETIYDYESPPNAARQYRARAARYDAATGNKATSNWSTVQSATVTNNEWWLKDVFDSSNNMTIEVENDPWDIEHPADIAVFNPLGRRYPVVVRDATVKAARFALQVPTIDAATYASLVALWESGHPMLLQVPGVDKQYYVQFNSPRQESLRNLNDPYRGNTLEFVEIERPTV